MIAGAVHVKEFLLNLFKYIFFEPFQKVTEAMTMEQYPTISSVKPLLYKLLERVLKVEDSDSSISKQIKKEIKSDLGWRYQSSELKTVLNVTTFLDPCY